MWGYIWWEYVLRGRFRNPERGPDSYSVGVFGVLFWGRKSFCQNWKTASTLHGCKRGGGPGSAPGSWTILTPVGRAVPCIPTWRTFPTGLEIFKSLFSESKRSHDVGSKLLPTSDCSYLLSFLLLFFSFLSLFLFIPMGTRPPSGHWEGPSNATYREWIVKA